MKLLHKKVLVSHSGNGAPVCGFATYIHAHKPILLRRLGWEIGNDVHDDFVDTISVDNGKTWSEPRPALSKSVVAGGYLTHTENSALYLPDRDWLLLFTNDKFEADLNSCDLNQSSRVRITHGAACDVANGRGASTQVYDFGLEQGLCISFSRPFYDSRGRVLMPVQWQRRDDGSLARQGFATRDTLPDVLCDVWQVGVLIGQWNGDVLSWRLSASPSLGFERSSRGLCEGTVAELSDGRFALVLRGSNKAWPERPGYKWLAFSDDGGDSWGQAQPLPCDDGSLIESSSTGSALFRSLTNNKLYWIGNLCTEGERPNNNMPRSPLFIGEVQEEPFALRKSTLFAIDRAAPHEDPHVQHSNFKFYQDRESGDVVLYLTRYGERGYNEGAWKKADLYEYRVQLD